MIIFNLPNRKANAFLQRNILPRCTFSLLCNSLCFPSIRVKIWEVWISPAVPLGFYVHTDARKFSSVYRFRYIRTRINLHTDVNLFSPVYKFCCIRTQVFLQLFRPAFRLRHGAVYIPKKRAFSFQKMLLLEKK